MITKHTGDLLSVETGIIVHGCNCLGVMGSGVAGVIRRKWPDIFALYSEHYHKFGLHLGEIQVAVGLNYETSGYRALGTLPKDLMVVNAMTQFDTAKGPGDVVVDYDAIFAAFSQIKIIAKQYGLPVHFPLIGCGLANGDWNIVSKLIEDALGPDVETHLWVLPT